jgi:hypothetical protein
MAQAATTRDAAGRPASSGPAREGTNGTGGHDRWAHTGGVRRSPAGFMSAGSRTEADTSCLAFASCPPSRSCWWTAWWPPAAPAATSQAPALRRHRDHPRRPAPPCCASAAASPRCGCTGGRRATAPPSPWPPSSWRPSHSSLHRPRQAVRPKRPHPAPRRRPRLHPGVPGTLTPIGTSQPPRRRTGGCTTVARIPGLIGVGWSATALVVRACTVR